MFFLLPFDLQARRGLTASEAGLTMLPAGIIIGVLSRLMGGLADRLGPRPFLVIGPVLVGLCGVGLALNLSNYWIGVLVPIAAFVGGHGDRRFAADDGGDELGAGLAFRRRLRRQQCREPARRRARHRRLRRGGGARLRLVRDRRTLRRAAAARRIRRAPPIEHAFLIAYSTAMGLAALWCFIAALAAHFSLPAKPPEKAAA